MNFYVQRPLIRLIMYQYIVEILGYNVIVHSSVETLPPGGTIDPMIVCHIYYCMTS